MRVIPVNKPELMPVSILSGKHQRKVSHGSFLQNPDWYLYRMLFPVK